MISFCDLKIITLYPQGLCWFQLLHPGHVCVCLCVCSPGRFSSTSVPPQAVGFVFSQGALLHLYSHSFRPASLRGCCHLYSPTRRRSSEADRRCFIIFFSIRFFFLFFFWEELLYTSQASDGWLLHRPGVNLSCVKLSVLKEAVCAAVVVADSRCGVAAAGRSVASWVCVVTCPRGLKMNLPTPHICPQNLHILILIDLSKGNWTVFHKLWSVKAIRGSVWQSVTSEWFSNP